MFQSRENASRLPSSSSAVTDFHGFLMGRSVSFSGADMPPDDEMSDDGSQFHGEKKRRLHVEQVRALEKSFELGSKLEPERKMELARALGLQPRQIAIWFQNRRARSKTKQLEKDYDVLKRQFDAIRADNESLKSQNKKLESQILALRKRESSGGTINLNREKEHSWSNATDNTGAATAAAVLFPPSMALGGGLTELLHSSAGGNHPPPSTAGSAGLCNLLGRIEENPDLWPWTDPQSFH